MRPPKWIKRATEKLRWSLYRKGKLPKRWKYSSEDLKMRIVELAAQRAKIPPNDKIAKAYVLALINLKENYNADPTDQTQEAYVLAQVEIQQKFGHEKYEKIIRVVSGVDR